MKAVSVRLLTTILAITVGITACTEPSKPQQKATLNISTTKLALIPDGYETGEIVFSLDGHNVAFSVKKDGYMFFGKNGEIGSKSYKNIQNITFGPANGRVVYRADFDDTRMCMVTDKTEGKTYADLGVPVFSPDGSIVAYEAMVGKQYVMAVGGRETPAFDMPYAPPFFSPDSKRIAYIEQHYDSKVNNLIFCNSDLSSRKKGKEYELINSIIQCMDRSKLAYVALKKGKKQVVTCDFSGNEQAGPEYDDVSGLAFSADGKHIAYVGKRGGNLVLVVDGKEAPFPAAEIASAPVFSLDGKGIAVIGRSGEKTWLVMNGKSGRQFDEIGKLGFSNDGKSTVFPAKKGAIWSIVVNGTEGSTSYDMVVAPQFSPDGSRIAYRARKDGKRFVVVADSNGRTLAELPRYEMVWQPVFTPDGKSIAYGVKSGQELWWKVEPLK